MSLTKPENLSVVICGCGIVGASAGYYLTKAGGITVTMVDRVGPAAAASGKAGGFLARTWCDKSGYGEFARKSFALHEELNTELGGGIGYRKVRAYSAVIRRAAQKRARGGARSNGTRRVLPGWLDQDLVVRASKIGQDRGTAQVHPELLTRKLIEVSQERGARLEIGEIVDIVPSELDGTTSYRVQLADGRQLEATYVILALGPWTQRALDWISAPLTCRISGVKVHSILFRLTSSFPEVVPQVVFAQYLGGTGPLREPEIYPRPDGTIYCCGDLDSPSDPPEDPATIEPNPVAVEALTQFVISSTLRHTFPVVVKTQACYLPVTSHGLPLIGELPSHRNLFVASGHTCWGILNGPATGLALAELITKGSCSFHNMQCFRPTQSR